MCGVLLLKKNIPRKNIFTKNCFKYELNTERDHYLHLDFILFIISKWKSIILGIFVFSAVNIFDDKNDEKNFLFDLLVFQKYSLKLPLNNEVVSAKVFVQNVVMCKYIHMYYVCICYSCTFPISGLMMSEFLSPNWICF